MNAMGNPILLLGLLSVIGFVLLKKKDEEGKQGEGGDKIPPGGVEDDAFAACLDDGLPPAMKDQVRNILSSVTDPVQLQAAADIAAQAGFPLAAACLQKKADELKKGSAGGRAKSVGFPFPINIPGFQGGKSSPGQPQAGQAPSVIPGFNIPPIQGQPLPGIENTPFPFTIRAGDFPVAVATYYTGQGTRFKELEPLNPHLGKLTTVNNVSNYPGWQVGVLILLPPSWNGASKPLPKPGTTEPQPTFGDDM